MNKWDAILSPSEFERAAKRLYCEVAAIKAVCEVEAPRGPFNPDGSCTTLFEGHKFSQFTQRRFDLTNPDLSYPKWTRQFYGKNWEEEQDRLRRAMRLDTVAAMLSTSWGMFQIMGFNHAAAGFPVVFNFVQAMRESAARQLEAFVNLIEVWELADDLREHKWADFARLYNGPGFRQNRYDAKLAEAYERLTAA